MDIENIFKLKSFQRLLSLWWKKFLVLLFKCVQYLR